MKKLEEALAAYRLASDTDQQLLANEPENAMCLRDTTVDFRNFGDIFLKEERLQEARTNYEKAMTIDKRLVERDKADRDTQSYLAQDYERIGRVLSKIGNGSEAIASFQTALRIQQELIKADPSDADAKDVLADDYVRLGDAYGALAQSAFRSRRDTYLNSGCSAYKNALKTWEALEKDGKMNDGSAAHRSSLAPKMAKCN